MHYFSLFFKKFKKPCVNILRIWTKTQFVGNSEKMFKIFPKKIAKNTLLLHIFQKSKQTMRKFFARLDEKQIVGNFEKIFENFQNIS